MKIAFGYNVSSGFVDFGHNYTSFVDEVDDGECTEINATKVLNYVPRQDFAQFIHNLVAKMRHGCVLSIGGHDIYETAKNILHGAYDVDFANKILYGDDNKPRLGQYSLNVLSDVLLHYGLKILEKNLEAGEMYVKAVRQ